MSKRESHELAGKTVRLNLAAEAPNLQTTATFRVEDWFENVVGMGWKSAKDTGNWAAKNYGLRAKIGGLPQDNDVVYGKVGGLGHIIHISELGELE